MALDDLRRAKLGPVTTPGGAQGTGTAQNITDTVSTLGPLEPGWYTIESTISFTILQCDLTAKNTPLTTTNLRTVGLTIPASAEVEFSVDGIHDQYLMWVTTVNSTSGTFKLNNRSKSYRG